MVLCQLKNEEIRNYCNCPKKFQLIDGLGAGLGIFFVISNIRGLKNQGFNGWNAVGLGLGSIMLYIHTARFFWAEEIKSGRRN